jgi:phosphatidylglycerol---prolipoprotein diacylglyceryl transferase
MHPIICKIGPMTIFSYGLMLAIAFIVCSALACRQAKKELLNPDMIFNLLFVTFICGIIGARLFYVSQNIGYYLKEPVQIIMLQNGGLSWVGGLILGCVSGIAFIKIKHLSVYKTLDLIAPYAALGQAIGRVGCLLNGCCYGRESSLGIYFPVHQGTLIPTQLYSSLLLVIIFIVLRLLQERPHKTGEIFFTYLLLYCAKRFFIDFFRADNPAIFFGLTIFQLLSIIIFFAAAVKLILIRRSPKAGS